MTRTILEPAGVCTEWVRIKMVRQRMHGALFCAQRRAKAGENARRQGCCAAIRMGFGAGMKPA